MLRFPCLCVLLTLLLLTAAPALAQEQAPAPEQSPELTAEEARALSLLLQEESRRQALVDKLNALAEAEAAPVEEPAAPPDASPRRQSAARTQQSAEAVAPLLARAARELTRP